MLNWAGMKRGWVILVLLLLGLWGWSDTLPRSPGGYVADFAGVLPADSKSSLEQQLNQWNGGSSTRIYLVTFAHLSTYGHTDVEAATRALASAWGLDGDDMMLLISVGDRKARIQLGRDWGNRYDAECSQTMRDVIVPACKIADYKMALGRGATALHGLAERGPRGAVSVGFTQRLETGMSHYFPFCMVPWPLAAVLMLAGVLCFIAALAGWVKDSDRVPMVGLAAALTLGTAFSGILVAIAGLVLVVMVMSVLPSCHHHCHHHCDSWSSSSGSSWFSSGGDSSWGGGGSDWGGGGSTGSW